MTSKCDWLMTSLHFNTLKKNMFTASIDRRNHSSRSRNRVNQQPMNFARQHVQQAVMAKIIARAARASVNAEQRINRFHRILRSESKMGIVRSTHTYLARLIIHVQKESRRDSRVRKKNSFGLIYEKLG